MKCHPVGELRIHIAVRTRVEALNGTEVDRGWCGGNMVPAPPRSPRSVSSAVARHSEPVILADPPRSLSNRASPRLSPRAILFSDALTRVRV